MRRAYRTILDRLFNHPIRVHLCSSVAKKMDKRTVQIISLFLVIAALGILGYRLFIPTQASFNATAWRGADSDAEFSKRMRMVHELLQLVRDGSLDTREKVQALLGPPDLKSDGRDDAWEYRLGTVDGSSDVQLLEFTFSESGRIRQAQIRQEVQSTRGDAVLRQVVKP